MANVGDSLRRLYPLQHRIYNLLGSARSPAPFRTRYIQYESSQRREQYRRTKSRTARRQGAQNSRGSRAAAVGRWTGDCQLALRQSNLRAAQSSAVVLGLQPCLLRFPDYFGFQSQHVANAGKTARPISWKVRCQSGHRAYSPLIPPPRGGGCE